MKTKLWLLALATLLLSACGDVEWFPDQTGTDNGGGTNTTTAPALSLALAPSAMLDGGSSTLTFTITNQSGNPAQTGLAFVETLPTGFTATVANSSQCGGNLAVPSSGRSIIFTSGSLAAGDASCTLTADLKLDSSLLNTITAERSFSVKSTEFGSLQGGLTNAVTDKTFKVFPSAVTGGGVTVSSLDAIGVNDATDTNVEVTFTATTGSNSGSAVNSTVTVAGIDASGAQVVSKTLSVAIQPGLINSGVQLNATPVTVPIADFTKIAFWRLVSVTAP